MFSARPLSLEAGYKRSIHAAFNRSMFPNEIFAIILQNLADDFSSLRSASLVCKDFCAIAQPYIFHEIGLKDGAGAIETYKCRAIVKSVNVTPFLQCSKLLRFIRRIYLTYRTPYFTDSKDAPLMLRSLTALNSFTIFNLGEPLICAMESTGLAATLKMLCVDCLHAEGQSLTLFASMLVSLQALEVLAMSDVFCGREDRMELVLPRSLKVLSLRIVLPQFLTNIGLGMKSSPLPSLQVVILGMLAPSDCEELWRGLGTRTHIVFEKEIFHSSDFVSLQGFIATRLLWIWEQETSFADTFCQYLSKLPDSVSELVIDLNSARRFGEDSVRRERDWAALDTALVETHERSSLTRVCFRCSNRRTFFDFDPRILAPGLTEDRSILDHVERLLPKSKCLHGFLEVDLEMEDFVPL